jgi:hypothetical protein
MMMLVLHQVIALPVSIYIVLGACCFSTALMTMFFVMGWVLSSMPARVSFAKFSLIFFTLELYLASGHLCTDMFDNQW